MVALPTRPFPRMLALIACVLSPALGLATACGPVQSTAFLIDAETMLEAATTAQAPRRAPYEFTAATLYLAKAKEEVGHSEYEQAVDYAKKAVDFATKARDAAVKAQKAEPVAP